MAKNNKDFWRSAAANNQAYYKYYNRLLELSCCMFDWINVPENIDKRFLELCEFAEGKAVFYYDEGLNQYCALRCMIAPPLDIYNNPIKRIAYATNGYRADLDSSNSVIIWNNYMREPSMRDTENFARRLALIDRIIDININAQKTPVTIICSEEQRLTMKNLAMKYEGNEPFIFGDKNLKPDLNIKALNTGAPYVASQLYDLKTQIWNEALTFLGIPNVSYQKRERLISDEVTREQGGTIASRFTRLNMRQEACEKINRMFGLNMWVEYRDINTDMESDNIE